MKSPLSIAAVVILYNPADNVYENIRGYHNNLEKLYVFDNTEYEHDLKPTILQLPNVEYYQDFKNEGIAKRLNTAVELALKDGFDWLLTMDQDTTFSQTAFSTYASCLNKFPDKENTALSGTKYSSTKEEITTECSVFEAENLITSGMMVNLAAAKVIGRFDENLFIDSIDHDYVIRAKLAGFRVVEFSNITILHKLGEEVNRTSIKTLFLLKKKKVIHSPLRSYYMYRNMLYLEKKFKNKDLYLAKGLRKIVTGNLLANFFYGRTILSTLKYLIKAKRDFKQNRMGQLHDTSE